MVGMVGCWVALLARHGTLTTSRDALLQLASPPLRASSHFADLDIPAGSHGCSWASIAT